MPTALAANTATGCLSCVVAEREQRLLLFLRLLLLLVGGRCGGGGGGVVADSLALGRLLRAAEGDAGEVRGGRLGCRRGGRIGVCVGGERGLVGERREALGWDASLDME
jgi:hypothetical protein